MVVLVYVALPPPHSLRYCSFIVHFNDSASALLKFFLAFLKRLFFQMSLRISYALGILIGMVLNLEIHLSRFTSYSPAVFCQSVSFCFLEPS